MRKSLFGTKSLVAAALLASLSACGGSDSSNVSVGGTITGLNTNGLVLQNGISSLIVPSGTTSFTFTAWINNGAQYNVVVQTQPTGQTCTVANGSGTASGSVTSVAVTCVQNNSLGGTITGLTTDGLKLANGSDVVAPAANSTSFTFPTRVPDGGAYGVTVLSQPTGQTCTVNNGIGTMGNTDINNVQVNCI